MKLKQDEEEPLYEMEAEKRAWNSGFQGGLGKRAWNSGFNGGLGKRAWNSFAGGYGKRGWNNFAGGEEYLLLLGVRLTRGALNKGGA